MKSSAKKFAKTEPPVLVVADVHLGNVGPMGGPVVGGLNQRCREILAALEDACERARAAGAREAISLGDFFDSHQPEPQVIRAAQIALERSGLAWSLLVGNHEQRTEERGDNALAPLAPVARAWIVDGPAGTIFETERYALVVGSGEAALEAMRTYPRRRSVFFGIHAGLWDDDFPKHLRESQGAISVESLRGEKLRVLAGDWHEQRSWGFATQIGALLPRNFGELGVDRGTFALVRWAGLGSRFVVDRMRSTGPRFVQCVGAGSVEPEIGAAASIGCAVRVELVSTSAEESAAMVAEIAASSAAHPGTVLGWRVRRERVAPSAEVSSFRKGETAERAISSFVRSAPEIEDSDRGGLLADALARWRST